MREGYKKTVLGEIPESWEVVRIGDVVELKMGQSPSSSAYNEEEVGLPLVQGNADIKNRKTVPRIWTDEITKTCDIDDIIMTVRAPVGAVALSDHYACIGRGVCAMNSDKIDKSFLYQFLISYESSWEKISQGSTFTAVNGNDIKSINLPSPPLHEQQKIAKILSTVDEKIDVIDQQIAETSELKKGLMQKLLTKGIRSLSGAEVKLKDSPLGEIPESWEVVKIGDVADVIDPQPDHRTPPEIEDGIPYVGMGDINNGRINFKGARKVAEGVLNKQIESFNIHPHAFVFGKIGTIGSPTLIPFERLYTYSANLILITSINERIARFLYVAIRSKSIENQIKLQVNSTSQPALGIKKVRDLLIPYPSNKEQQKIASILSTVDDKLDILKDKKSEYQKLKKGLMQKLLTGKVRVNCIP